MYFVCFVHVYEHLCQIEQSKTINDDKIYNPFAVGQNYIPHITRSIEASFCSLVGKNILPCRIKDITFTKNIICYLKAINNVAVKCSSLVDLLIINFIPYCNALHSHNTCIRGKTFLNSKNQAYHCAQTNVYECFMKNRFTYSKSI